MEEGTGYGGSRRKARPCRGCYYWEGGICKYLIATGHKRPCPPGANCTVRRDKVPGDTGVWMSEIKTRSRRFRQANADRKGKEA